MKQVIALMLVCLLMVGGAVLAEPVTDVTLTLAENPTTGYTWSFVSSNDAIVTVADQGYTASPNLENADGVGGTHTWLLQGKAEGDATVTFTIGQSWEGGEVADMLVFAYHVGADMTITQTAVGGVPELYMPDYAVVLLNENPTTGYQWAYEASAEGILTPVRDVYEAPEASDSTQLIAVGAGGVHMWVFSGMAQGDVTLTFTYARSWEQGVAPDATITYTYHVASDLSVTQTAVEGDYADYDLLLGAAAAK